MAPPATITVEGSPTGPGRRSRSPTWRARVAGATAGTSPVDGIALAFTLEPGRWIDLDTITEETLSGLRDAGVCRPRFAGLDAVLATRDDGAAPGVVVDPVGAAVLDRRRPPGPALLDVAGDVLPRAGRRDDKRAWREALAAAWGGRPPLAGPVWADLELAVGGSLLGPLEPALDALEPVLGRDPRGRDWQEFFPNDHVIRWLRVRRCPALPAALRLRLGPSQHPMAIAGATASPGTAENGHRSPLRPFTSQAIDSGAASAPPASPRAHDQT